MNFGLKKKKEAPQKPDPASIAALVEAIPEKSNPLILSELSDIALLGNVYIQNNDITQNWGFQATEWNAIVVPQYPDKACYQGVSGAVSRVHTRKGIQKGFLAYEKYVKEKGPLEYGTVVATSAGQISDILFLHVVSLGADKEKDFAVVKECVFNALRLVQENGLAGYVAIPALNVNTLGTLTYTQSAEAILQGIMENKKAGGGKPPAITLVLPNQWMKRAFLDVLKSRSFVTADNNQPGEHDPNEGVCIATRPAKPTQIDRPLKGAGSDKPDLT